MTRKLNLNPFFDGMGGPSGSGGGDKGGEGITPPAPSLGIRDYRTPEQRILEDGAPEAEPEETPEPKKKTRAPEVEDEVKDENEEEDDSSTDEETDEEDTQENEEDVDEGEESDEDDENDEDDDTELDQDDNLYQAIKKYDPKILKRVPGLRASIFRDQQFSKFFPNPKDAEKAFNDSRVLREFESDIFAGKAEPILQVLHKSGKRHLESYVANLLPSLEKIEPTLVVKMLAPEFKKAIRHALAHGNADEKSAARDFHRFIFGHDDINKNEGIEPPQKDEREVELERREKEFAQKQYQTFATDVKEVAYKRAKNLISKRFEGVDISELQKRHLTDEIFARVTQSLDKDVRYQGSMTELWNTAAKEGFTYSGKDRIISAFLSRAKVMIPSVHQAVLAEARIKASGESAGRKRKPKRVPSGVNRAPAGNGKIDPKNIDWSKTTERDILDGKAPTLRS